MKKVTRTWIKGDFFYAEIEETRNFLLFKTKKTYEVFTTYVPFFKHRGYVFRRSDTGKPVNVDDIIAAYETKRL